MPVMILLLLWPLLEIAGFVWIGGALGVGPTLGFVLLSGLVGTAWLRRAGGATLMRLRAGRAAGETPVPAALDGVWRILAAVLMVVPGFFSSGVALLMLLPPVRAGLTRLAERRFGPGSAGIWVVGASRRTSSEPGSTTIEGEFRELPTEPPELPPRR
jgi:UPF0716 protein FxsA